MTYQAVALSSRRNGNISAFGALQSRATNETGLSHLIVPLYN
jgi:hypothetical protein